MSPVTIFVNEGTGVSVTGTLDATTVGNLNKALTDFFAQASHIEVLELDLSTVTMCDEAVRAAIRFARAMCTEHMVALRVIPSEAVRHAMRPRD